MLFPLKFKCEDTMTDKWKNKLYFVDNLCIMQDYIPDESVDLI